MPFAVCNWPANTPPSDELAQIPLLSFKIFITQFLVSPSSLLRVPNPIILFTSFQGLLCFGLHIRDVAVAVTT